MLRVYKILIYFFVIFYVDCDQQNTAVWWRKIHQSSPTIYAMVAPQESHQITDSSSENTKTTLHKSDRKSDEPSILSSSLRQQITQRICPPAAESTRTVVEYDNRPSLMEQTHRFNILYQYMEERVSNLTLLYHNERLQNIELKKEVTKFQESNTELIVYMDMLEKEIMYLNNKVKTTEASVLKNHAITDIHDIGIHVYDGDKMNHGQISGFSGIPSNMQYVTHNKNKFNIPQLLNSHNNNKHNIAPGHNTHNTNTQHSSNINGIQITPIRPQEIGGDYEIHSHLDLSNYNVHSLYNLNKFTSNNNNDNDESSKEEISIEKIDEIETTAMPIPVTTTTTTTTTTERNIVNHFQNSNDHHNNYAATSIAGTSLFCSQYKKIHKVCSDSEDILESIMALLNYASSQIK